MKPIHILITLLLLTNLAIADKPTYINETNNREVKMDRYNDVATVLDSLHIAASKADAKGYFNLFADDAVFIGTDVGEYWSLSEFKSYAIPSFNKGKGWTYVPRNREINFSKSGEVAWFHEVLDNKNYGTTRGTGVLIYIENKGWLISQYHLTIPIPNNIAVELTDKIKAYEAEATKASVE